MHLAKGLVFRAVAVMARDDEIIPLRERIEAVSDDADLRVVYDPERHLLYVACSRARDHLLVSGVDPVLEFLDEFMRSPMLKLSPNLKRKGLLHDPAASSERTLAVRLHNPFAPVANRSRWHHIPES